ncbi:phosphoribosylglycinamide formyltransferase [Campylobacter sputorum subsp. bubulus]|uniref:Phosphoribosylglycinamide formyltransferase n=1 Tax=Campylobacter sputorum subsp. sputorum TaxID=32024 RepID=A0A381DKM8_9BACT|nr:phosphoribosylglycinamide formyltransferase [Campylobacter sputorum]ASM34524.1 phosphoribosylglycinamide formyltransferase 1 [Campylobacter sputorum aubsp. sputorum RM3237]KAB0580747.1 phosphoribosylglycinamide formyltransferase [Campylobacter sputorum subsp. sputorum]QEL04714.1 phosphoribosylglycinamide formyltransferase 1 [Campylobacter sputorum subsp. sputorum]SUX09605.1 phosphoribosylglycinamide formyltransferase [Campylobacter sputorum subsp. bubulus]SUX11195.1 phosphoribosylglycinamid
MSVKNIAILFSGNGSNLEAILNKVHNKTFGNTTIKCTLCISNKPDAYGIIRAKKFELDTIIIENKNFKTREDFDKALVDEIQKYDIDLVVLAGFMRILTPVFTSQIKAINLHPSILPLFKGAHAIKESFQSEMMVGGVSVHMVSEELDGGKIIAQETFKREKNMSLEKWEEKTHSLEHEILPQSIINLLTE